jgi:hypothetical protein
LLLLPITAASSFVFNDTSLHVNISYLATPFIPFSEDCVEYLV